MTSLVYEKRKVSSEIKEYIRQNLLPPIPYVGDDGMFYEEWRKFHCGMYTTMVRLSEGVVIASIVYDRGMKEQFKTDRSLWTAFCRASVSLEKTRSFIRFLREKVTDERYFNQILDQLDDDDPFRDYLSKYQYENMEKNIDPGKVNDNIATWYHYVLHFEREIEQNTENYLQHITQLLRNIYGDVPLPNSPREAVDIMRRMLNL